MIISELSRAPRRRRLAALAASFAIGLACLPADAQIFSRTPVPPAEIGGGNVIDVQSSAAMAEQSMRMDQMQEQMRQLTGQIEQLTYQVQQLQETLRRTQEDNEYRFQTLEGGGAPPKKRSEVPSAAPGTTTASRIPPATVGPDPSLPSDLSGPMDAGGGNVDYGAPPAVLGTIPGDGSAVAPPSESALGGPLDLSAIARGEEPSVAAVPSGPAAGLPGVSGSAMPPLTTQPSAAPSIGAAPVTPGSDVAVVAPPTDPRAAYDAAYEKVLSGDYAGAETSFKRFLADHPKSELAGNASFWLGESYYARNRYREAADAYLSTYRDHPKSQKAPESLLKLGLALEGLGEKDAACATYAELSKKFSNAPAALLERVSAQRSSAGC